MTARVRPATPHDLQAVTVTEAEASHAPWSERSVAAQLGRADRPSWVALDAGGAVVGHLLSLVVLDEAELLTIAVRGHARRRGIGRALLTVAERGWREAGVRSAFLEVRDDNAPARGLYEGAGWSHVGHRRGYYRDGADAALYRWEAT